MSWRAVVVLLMVLALAGAVQAETLALVCPPEALPGWERRAGGIEGEITCWASYAGAPPQVAVANGALIETRVYPGDGGGSLALRIRAGEPGWMVVTAGERSFRVRVISPWSGRWHWLPVVGR